MRNTARNENLLFRKAHLDAEKKRFLSIPNTPFTLVKDWDDDPKVIWEGWLEDKSLKNRYKIKFVYGRDYPFRRPHIYPLGTLIKGNRHQNPSPRTSGDPGDICIFQDGLDDWVVGVTCHEILDRAIKWFKKYEDRVLDMEPAPAEIERYYPEEFHIQKPRILLVSSLINTEDQNDGGLICIPSASGRFAIISVLGRQGSKAVVGEIIRMGKILLPYDQFTNDNWLKGHWIKITKEPFSPLLETKADLLRFMADFGVEKGDFVQLSKILGNQKNKLVALIYPTGRSEDKWLIFEAEIKPPNINPDIFSKFRPGARRKYVHNQNKGALKVYSNYDIGRKTIFHRVPGSTADILRTRKVMLLGCGSIGSKVSELLVQSGLERLILVDNDELRAGNVCRHALGLGYIGEPKATALKEHLLQYNPFADITPFPADILRLEERLDLYLQDIDLVVSCIGKDAIETWVNMQAMSRHKQVLFCRTYAHALLGEIILARPRQGCFQCLSQTLQDEYFDIPRAPSLPFNEAFGFDNDCGAAFIPASSVDIEFIALQFARLILDCLMVRPIEKNYWLVRGREVGPDEKWQLDEQIMDANKIYGYAVSPGKCRICGS